MSNLTANAQSPSPGALVSLYRLDATSVGGQVLYFCEGAYGTSNVVFGGVTYTAVDVEFSGFETSGQGGLPTPHVKLSNTNGVFQGIVNAVGDMQGCEIQRIRTFGQFLDHGAQPDPSAFYGPDTFRIERKVNENPIFIEWELSASIDEQGKMLPGRVVLRDTCLWRYRFWNGTAFDYSKAQCPYTGTAYWDALDQSQTDPSKDQCSRRLSACKLRFGANNPLPFGGFPGAARVGGN